MKTTIGGDRLGSGNKQETSYRNYNRSSHDLGYTWRSSMSSGTLVPFLNRVALPGDKWNINLNAEVLTLPTVGPLFGSYKVQLDIFEVPMRLYNAKLHMNKLGIGMDMGQIYLPQVAVYADNTAGQQNSWEDNSQVNASALIKYLGISGLGRWDKTWGAAYNPMSRFFNAIPLLAYWDIYKNYYSNKQEERGFYIHSDNTLYSESMTPQDATLYSDEGTDKGNVFDPNNEQVAAGDYVYIQFGQNALEPKPETIKCAIDASPHNLNVLFDSFVWSQPYNMLVCQGPTATATAAGQFKVLPVAAEAKNKVFNFFGLKEFDLKNIDTMREKILQFAGANEFVIDGTTNSIEPYNAHLQFMVNNTAFSAKYSQEGLGLKTYQSDLFNNWINTEWIDGAGGISELTAVDTSGNSFTIDALNIASKVYDMLNRIAVSGGTYDDWLEAVYTHERVRGVESPVYCGSLIRELMFEEVISTAKTTDHPLGTLAGRGRMSGKNKGGNIEISVNEPSVIIGICSITPRVDYSQGNDWAVNLKTYDDFHKPALDAIGFQDLITEQMLWQDTEIIEGGLKKSSLGKQPAWINYMTEVNRCYGAFAEQDNSMFMTLNRRYEHDDLGKLKDPTTYIDPTKYNQIFAETSLDSQNFWMQISCDITARRKMSAKVIPNL
ncbi:MAG: major capsid protein [Microviridae sp.]|nr:MAG: major capsid protein [Microviridae sp.]